jgi:hypothetical protein
MREYLNDWVQENARCAAEADPSVDDLLSRYACSHPGVEDWYEIPAHEFPKLRAAILASAGQAEKQKPIATLHDDGYWTWKPGMRMHECNQAGWWMDVYAAPTPAAAQDGPKCRACNGNDGDIPCAYPEGHPHCLRNAAAQDERGAFEKAIDKLIYTAWYSGEQDGSDGVKWSEIGDSYNSMLRSRINDDKKALLALIARAAASPVSREANIRHWRNRIIKAMRTSSRGDLTIALDAILKEMTEEIERIDRKETRVDARVRKETQERARDDRETMHMRRDAAKGSGDHD